MKINIKTFKQKKSTQELLEFGIINIDKPSGPTSFNISDHVRKILNLRKTSHFGTLDPKVTGVLPIALNRACKLTGYFLGEDKEYVGVMRIHEDISLNKIKKAIKEKFTGKITQLPPVKSRVKRQERQRLIKSFELLEKDGQNILFKTEVQGGTYIRKLIHDLGEELGIGAHMLELRRIRAGIFSEEGDLARLSSLSTEGAEGREGRESEQDHKFQSYPSVTLYELEEALKDENKLKEIIIPGEIITELFPVIEIKESIKVKLLTGKPIHSEDLRKKSDLTEGETAIAFCKEQFIGIYKIIKSQEIFAKPLFVMQPIQ
ncbi:MAG: RNA-guided pseudouridylation complex pseudouridine synthase subunit Cbf5 [archaeon]